MVGVAAQVGGMPGAPVGARHSVMGGGGRVGYCLMLPCFACPWLVCFGLSQCDLVSCGCGITRALLEEFENWSQRVLDTAV